MYRVTVLYEQEPDADRFARHAGLCRRVQGGEFRHGRVARTLAGSGLAYDPEWEFPDADSFRAAAATGEFGATGADAAEMGSAHSVHVVDLGG